MIFSKLQIVFRAPQKPLQRYKKFQYLQQKISKKIEGQKNTGFTDKG